jgi:hypothetical protein
MTRFSIPPFKNPVSSGITNQRGAGQTYFSPFSPSGKKIPSARSRRINQRRRIAWLHAESLNSPEFWRVSMVAEFTKIHGTEARVSVTLMSGNTCENRSMIHGGLMHGRVRSFPPHTVSGPASMRIHAGSHRTSPDFAAARGNGVAAARISREISTRPTDAA